MIASIGLRTCFEQDSDEIQQDRSYNEIIGTSVLIPPDQGRLIMPNTDIEVGSSAPDFKLLSNEHAEIGLSDYRGKKVILFFVREYN